MPTTAPTETKPARAKNARKTAKSFADLIRKWQGDRSLAECAAVMHVAPNTIRNWTLHILPPATRVPVIAQVLGVEPAWLAELVASEQQQARG